MSDRERQLRDGWRARWVAKRMTERGDGYGAVLRRWAIEMRRSPSLHERALGHYFEALRRSA